MAMDMRQQAKQRNGSVHHWIDLVDLKSVFKQQLSYSHLVDVKLRANVEYNIRLTLKPGLTCMRLASLLYTCLTAALASNHEAHSRSDIGVTTVHKPST